jgi:hypothetical protein
MTTVWVDIRRISDPPTMKGRALSKAVGMRSELSRDGNPALRQRVHDRSIAERIVELDGDSGSAVFVLRRVRDSHQDLHLTWCLVDGHVRVVGVAGRRHDVDDTVVGTQPCIEQRGLARGGACSERHSEQRGHRHGPCSRRSQSPRRSTVPHLPDGAADTTPCPRSMPEHALFIVGR